MSFVRCQGLSYAYQDHQALDDICLEVEQRQLFGIIGPDGAGKTTLFRILASLLAYTRGQVRVMGYDPVKHYREIRQRIGYMPGRFSLYQDLTVSENLRFYASVFQADMKSAMPLIEEIFSQLHPFMKRRAGQLSGGMKQKLALSCALIHQPSLLILDEPTTGVDAVSRMEFWNVLKSLKDLGMTILVSTPYMDEAQRCDTIALFQQGRLLETDSPTAVSERFVGSLYRMASADRYGLMQSVQASGLVETVYLNGQYIHMVIEQQRYAPFLAYLRSRGLEGLPVPVKATVEDRFIQLMQPKHAEN